MSVKRVIDNKKIGANIRLARVKKNDEPVRTSKTSWCNTDSYE